MTATTDRPVYRLTFGGVLSSEMLKLVTLRSTWVIVAVAGLLQVAIGALFGLFVRTSTDTPVDVAPVDLVTEGVPFSVLAVVVLAVLAVTAEYSSGQIRVTVAAVPRRTPMLVAKLVAVVALVFVTGAAAAAAAYAIGSAIGGEGLVSTYATGETWRMLVGGPLYLAGVAALSFGLAFVIRSTAGAISTMMGLLLVLPPVLMALPFSWARQIAPWVPSTAGDRIRYPDAAFDALNPYAEPGVVALGPWQGYGVLLAWAALAVVAGLVLLRRRDV
jgi:ABC-2 type transport system permease protein